MIKIPNYDEVVQAVNLGQDMWGEGSFKVTGTYNTHAALEFASHAVNQHLSGGLFYFKVAVRDDKVVGMMIGQLVPFFFCPDKTMAVDHIVYVDPNYRGSSIAYRLVKDFEEWARKKSAIQISFGVSTGVKIEKTHDFYTKMGYNHTGGIYKKTIGQGA